MKKIIIFSTVILAIGLIVLYNIGIYPFIVFQENGNSHSHSVNTGDENKPFLHIDFQKGNYTAYAIIGISNVLNLPASIPRYRVLKTSDKQVLNQLKNCEFITAKSKLAAVESRFCLLKGDSLVYESGLVLDEEYEGFQNDRIGLAECKQKGQLAKIISQFEKEIKPIIFLK